MGFLSVETVLESRIHSYTLWLSGKYFVLSLCWFQYLPIEVYVNILYYIIYCVILKIELNNIWIYDGWVLLFHTFFCFLIALI